MKKPSMFSKDYEKEVKKRRKTILLLIIVPIIGLSIFLATDFDFLLSKPKINAEDKGSKAAESQKKSEEVVKQQADDEKSKAAEASAKAEAALKAEAVEKNEIFTASFSDGQKISVEYNVKSGEKNIKGVSNTKDISYDISPSKKAIVVQSTKNQDMLYIDVNKITKDITKKEYKSSKGEVFPKVNKLKEKPTYIWSITPKFIDEDNIAYVSELPWMKEKEVQYIWKVNLKNNEHTQVMSLSGKQITFKNITAKGLETIVDGQVVYVNLLGEVTQ
ncbi:hypothetical protein K2F40_02675 [Clostridium sp. CM028]|uniref:hypothetical protein n=1 Tax=Clostridium sp. CM028 TaxID=2851575 RepID=UPI001C6DD816|nr:hypothetical protein [Clostridium sp. CM028]MBW9147885.1 hypothetical protein [Clostridium sp. CM028]WLC61322.1 hypothetical protein KTC94_14730 [Clostridium sp. CM028]